MNMICICLDTFRADIIGEGKKLSFVETPNLDKFARESVIFDNAFGECQPTLQMRRAFFTGRRSFPWRYNFDRRGMHHHAAGWHKIPPDQDTVAEILVNHGYLTGLISDTYHMFKATTNYTRGFVTYDFIRGQESDRWKFGDLDKIKKKLELYVDHPEATGLHAHLIQYLFNTQDRSKEEDYFCAQVFIKAAEWIKNNMNNQPFFLWVDSFDPHEPWDPPREYADKYCPDYEGKEYIFGRPPPYATEKEIERVKALYYGEVTLVDKWFGYFMQELEDSGLLDNTIVMLLSDHGTQLMDHGRFGKDPNELHPFNTQILWYIRHPDGPRNKHISAFVQGHDVMPTILNLLDVPYADVDGVNVWPLVTGERELIRDHVVIAWAGWNNGPAVGRVSVRDEEWNYIHNVGQNDSNPELYHLPNDPEEKNNVVSQYPEVVSKQRRRIEAVLKQPLPGMMNEICDLPPSTLRLYLLRKEELKKRGAFR